MRWKVEIRDEVTYEIPEGVAEDEGEAMDIALEFWAERMPKIMATRIDG